VNTRFVVLTIYEERTWDETIEIRPHYSWSNETQLGPRIESYIQLSFHTLFFPVSHSQRQKMIQLVVVVFCVGMIGTRSRLAP
jgi:hypothetical protein